jgi:imidazolonepropionase
MAKHNVKMKTEQSPITAIIKNAGQLVTMNLTGHLGPRHGEKMSELGIIKNGAVAISGNRIVAVEQTPRMLKKIKTDKNIKIIDAEGRLVTPGLVDPHCHPVFGGNRANEFEMRLAGKDYLEIAKAGGGIKSTVRATRKASPQQLYERGKKVIEKMLGSGVTTIEGKSGYGLNTQAEIKILKVLNQLGQDTKASIVTTFLGAHEIPEEFEHNPDDYVALICGEMIPTVASLGLAEFCDIFCEKGVFSPKQTRVVMQTAQAFGLKLKIHADQLHSTGGAELAAEFGAVSADHLDCVAHEGIHLMKKAGVVAVLLPGSVFVLDVKRRAPARQMIEYGLPVALGSDFNPGSSPILSLPLTMSLACILFKMTPAESLCAATINAAYAIDRGDKIGSLSPGKMADMVIWDADDFREIPYWIGQNLVKSVIKNGKQIL